MCWVVLCRTRWKLGIIWAATYLNAWALYLYTVKYMGVNNGNLRHMVPSPYDRRKGGVFTLG